MANDDDDDALYIKAEGRLWLSSTNMHEYSSPFHCWHESWHVPQYPLPSSIPTPQTLHTGLKQWSKEGVHAGSPVQRVWGEQDPLPRSKEILNSWRRKVVMRIPVRKTWRQAEGRVKRKQKGLEYKVRVNTTYLYCQFTFALKVRLFFFYDWPVSLYMNASFGQFTLLMTAVSNKLQYSTKKIFSSLSAINVYSIYHWLFYIHAMFTNLFNYLCNGRRRLRIFVYNHP